VLHWGERTLRHNAIRDVVHVWIDRAGLNPEKERPDLLPRRDGVSFSSNEETCQHAAAAYADLKPAHAETLAAFVAAREGAAVADLYSRLLQELSITTRRFRAQAALRRRAEIINQTQPIARASAVLPEG
jgi:hypothetical protein